MSENTDGRRWWHGAVIYQLYVRSWRDSNDDGYGDLRGIIERLDYLSWLGVDAVWLSPTMPSPDDDWGYDVSDYTGVHPEPGEVIQAVDDAAQVAVPVVIAVLEGPYVQLIDDGTVPPAAPVRVPVHLPPHEGRRATGASLRSRGRALDFACRRADTG